MTTHRVTSNNDIYYNFFWELSIESFPSNERRPLDSQLWAISNSSYHLEILLDNGTPVGFITWWEMCDYRFIEHFATSPDMRGKGYGAKVLQWFISVSDKPIILECEHPTTEINIRRIEFYKRLGFKVNPHNYHQPPYSKGGDSVHLAILTYPNEISYDELQSFVRNYPLSYVG